jgi:hypothetical protein
MHVGGSGDNYRRQRLEGQTQQNVHAYSVIYTLLRLRVRFATIVGGTV